MVEAELNLGRSVAWEVRMPGTGWTPRIVPYGADQTVYLVIDRLSGLGSVLA